LGHFSAPTPKEMILRCFQNNVESSVSNFRQFYSYANHDWVMNTPKEKRVHLIHDKIQDGGLKTGYNKTMKKDQNECFHVKTNSHPLILLTGYYLAGEQWTGKRPCTRSDQDVFLSTMDYPRAIFAAGAYPLFAPPLLDPAFIKRIVSEADGVLLTGGADIHPSRYGEEPHIRLGRVSKERDAFEWTLLDTALEMKKPVLGICRGLQLINIFFGGSLYQDIYFQRTAEIKHSGSRPKDERAHDVFLQKGSTLFEAYGKEKISVNSFHHQAVKKLGRDLRDTGLSEDGIIEGVEGESGRLVAVQWHPEMMFEKEREQLNLFSFFIREIVLKNQRRQSYEL